MEDLRSRLRRWRGRRLWLLGVGNAERGDDGFGPALTAAVRAALGDPGAVHTVDVGTCPERYVGVAAEAGCQELVFADAVDFGGSPGAVLLATAAELQAGCIVTSTHRVSLAVLAKYAEGLGVRAWLLGVQPRAMEHGAGLSPEVAGSLEALVEILRQELRDAEKPGVDP